MRIYANTTRIAQIFLPANPFRIAIFSEGEVIKTIRNYTVTNSKLSEYLSDTEQYRTDDVTQIGPYDTANGLLFTGLGPRQLPRMLPFGKRVELGTYVHVFETEPDTIENFTIVGDIFTVADKTKRGCIVFGDKAILYNKKELVSGPKDALYTEFATC